MAYFNRELTRVLNEWEPINMGLDQYDDDGDLSKFMDGLTLHIKNVRLEFIERGKAITKLMKSLIPWDITGSVSDENDAGEWSEKVPWRYFQYWGGGIANQIITPIIWMVENIQDICKKNNIGRMWGTDDQLERVRMIILDIKKARTNMRKWVKEFSGALGRVSERFKGLEVFQRHIPAFIARTNELIIYLQHISNGLSIYVTKDKKRMPRGAEGF